MTSTGSKPSSTSTGTGFRATRIAYCGAMVFSFGCWSLYSAILRRLRCWLREAMCRPKLLDVSLGGLFHSLAYFVDLTPNHIVELAIVPDELNIGKDFLVRGILAWEQFLLACSKVHRVFHNLWIVEQAHFYKKKARFKLNQKGRVLSQKATTFGNSPSQSTGSRKASEFLSFSIDSISPFT